VQEAIFYTNTSFSTPGGATISNIENENVHNVTLDELPDQLKELVTSAMS
jgi:hypothetical protein